MLVQQSEQPQRPTRNCPGVPAPQFVDVAVLLGRSNEIRLLHRGQEYRLRITRAGKLILTK
jgi:hemin uptake protein HemP